MSSTTKIQWTEVTWNPTTGCDRVSPGCDNCYALTLAKRLKAMGQARYQRDGDPRTSGPGFGLTVHPDAVNEPLRWRKPRKVFVNSMSDLFHTEVPDPWLADIFAVMAAARQHVFQVLTKRHGRARSLLSNDDWVSQVRSRAIGKGLPAEDWQWPIPGIWLGVSVEDQKRADLRVPALAQTPAAVRFLSCEPLLGRVDLSRWLRPIPDCKHIDPDDGTCGHPDAYSPECWRGADCPLVKLGEWHGPDWIIVGGESGRGARPMDLAWAEQIVHDCQVADVPVFVKQLGVRTGGKSHHDIEQFPAGLRVREYPTAA